MIDIHAHLCFGDYDKDMDIIISRCKNELAAVIVGSARYEECIKALVLSNKYPNFIFPTLGYHPTEGGEEVEKIFELIEKNKDKIVGIGEVGLDYHWEKDKIKRKKQKEIFVKFIELAEKLNKPMVIHSWDAEEECFEILKSYNVQAVFHCFSGSKELSKKIVSEGFYISISTMVLFSKDVKKIAKILPMDKLLLETDSPFLSPNKEKDRRNYPWNIKLSAEKIAELRGISKEDILMAAKENAIKFFRLKKSLSTHI
ncbi:MAG: TatD family hydrolase [Candidatus Aenigmatarchaeota archaeon]